MIKRKANAVWKGTLQTGKGTMSYGSYTGNYSFTSRFEDGEGTNPEEMIGAAHAGCFSMALGASLGKEGFKPNKIETTAEVTMEKQEGGFVITSILLKTEADVPDIEEDKFMKIANGAKEGCPVSQALSALDIKLEAKLV